MTICYLVLAHHKFDQAMRMVRRLADSESGFVFHIDSGANRAAVRVFKEQLRSIGSVAFAESVRARWGSYRQALAIMHCVKAAMALNTTFDRYVLLSAQDYPIASTAEINEFFERHAQVEFLEAFARDVMDETEPGWSPYFRFRRYHYWIGKKHLQVPLLRKGAPPLPIYHGSTWWALTRDAVKYVAEQFESNRSLRRYLKTGFLVDEVYIPTILMSSPFVGNISGHNVTYAQWTPTSGPHPKTLRRDDLTDLIASPKLFARKFDEQIDVSLMDELDALHCAQ